MNPKKFVLWSALAVFTAHALAVEPAGTIACANVVKVHDGDTFTCVHADGSLRVRVAGIDAPETTQGFWRVSRDLLGKRAGPGTVVDCSKLDRYERQVCRVFSSEGEDLALELVRTGLAWRTRKYADEQTQSEREAYAAAEGSARERRLGLWSQPDPQDPSECRALKKQQQRCR